MNRIGDILNNGSGTLPRPMNVCEVCGEECGYYFSLELPMSGTYGYIYDGGSERCLNMCESCADAIQGVIGERLKRKGAAE
ncbi:MAG: hypothetical protein NC299_08990 [Lachnospiraceae bacterium]|nr:hypothetical protein [Lachnospiraceae bacterium]